MAWQTKGYISAASLNRQWFRRMACRARRVLDPADSTPELSTGPASPVLMMLSVNASELSSANADRFALPASFCALFRRLLLRCSSLLCLVRLSLCITDLLSKSEACHGTSRDSNRSSSPSGHLLSATFSRIFHTQSCLFVVVLPAKSCDGGDNKRFTGNVGRCRQAMLPR